MARNGPWGFKQAVSCVLVNWPALQIAVENSFGGFSTEKGTWMVTVITDFIEQTPHVNKDDVHDCLNDLMDQEFNTLIEDGSLESISENLCDLWEKNLQGRSEEVQDYVTQSLKTKNKSMLSGLLPYQNPESSKMKVKEPEQSANCSLEGNEDSWTVVGSKKKKILHHDMTL